MEQSRANVLNSDEAREKYLTRTFTPEGKKTIEGFVYNLAKLYFENGEQAFPMILPPVLGIPYIRTALTYQTKRELEIHIKTLLHLLALKGVEVNGEEFKMEIEQNGNSN